MATKTSPNNFKAEILSVAGGLLGLFILGLIANQTSLNPINLRSKRQILNDDQAQSENEYDDIELDSDIFDQ